MTSLNMKSNRSYATFKGIVEIMVHKTGDR